MFQLSVTSPRKVCKVLPCCMATAVFVIHKHKQSQIREVEFHVII